MKTYAYGFPRVGKNREFKKSVEAFWAGELSEKKTQEALVQIQKDILAAYEKNGIDQFPIGEVTGYDPMFDAAIMVGVYRPKNLKAYYEFCRGKNALEMTKWFNTNYHYLVPDFSALGAVKFSVNWNKAKEYLDQFKKGTPSIIGPFTFLKLSKGIPAAKFGKTLQQLTKVYQKILATIPEVHLEEPAFVLELSKEEVAMIQEAYKVLATSGCKIRLITYYDSVDFLKELTQLPVDAIGLDFVNGPANLQSLKKYGFPKGKTLIAGLVNGRNVWRTDVKKAVETLKEISAVAKNVVVSNAAPLFHLPISLEGEGKLDAEVKKRLAFAQEKLEDIREIANVFDGKQKARDLNLNGLWKNEKMRNRVQALTAADFQKKESVEERRAIHEKQFNLPLFPTTTIGSFPQTPEVRKQRADVRAGRISEEQYKTFVRKSIVDLVKWQEKMGLDVLVHGEFERTDMVEFFAEKLNGIATTQGGWIISYGTRAYRPPVIFGDISRPAPMTIDEIQYAQTLTKKPMKGMLTGPVTIIAWSFVREDVPIAEVAYQLGLCLQDEIRDYEKAGIRIVQVDEPAIREKAPIKKRDWPSYFDWAINSFKLSINTEPQTQIHTHMCYSEFGEIVEQIDAMDFDVISIETTRSRGDIIESFERIDFKKQIGLGVWDIHSPAVPTKAQMKKIVQRALKVIPKENFWINPDCGLKTRGWKETESSLKNLVELSKELRKSAPAKPKAGASRRRVMASSSCQCCEC
ncbi:MAG: 5-methyltetrahydropteroyltriglutamate--homocysteine S-methyltransferase [Candidatus Omnitrophica bacterium]|nr:5-methyltetrahydropteroyltriglutamate--homocysteine S-methyltransferase [Candidatus Omnitrophota bacterium]